MVTEQEVEAVGQTLVDPGKPLQARFRALFTLRGLGGPAAIAWISRAFGDDSALLKHELAYCLGQMQDPRAIPVLLDVLRDTRQEPMVRHEAGVGHARAGGRGGDGGLEPGLATLRGVPPAAAGQHPPAQVCAVPAAGCAPGGGRGLCHRRASHQGPRSRPGRLGFRPEAGPGGCAPGAARGPRGRGSGRAGPAAGAGLAGERGCRRGRRGGPRRSPRPGPPPPLHPLQRPTGPKLLLEAGLSRALPSRPEAGSSPFGGFVNQTCARLEPFHP
ncbi:deoxyhypusine hydroxylase isoform X3 [Hippopotamus amphibius kiboko]|uniref:deoxyhypusine hydroxylase isoform X3 n=1 Tax=Hippopotamus amphibius kiboko TaxID=575201 RepID=UPI00259AD999|nr:deoxyhypusine hydroxylase isoform X3 [Hippopotamus amphibius kiboko]